MFGSEPQNPAPFEVGYFRIRMERDQSVVVEFRTDKDGALIARVPLTRQAADALSDALSPEKRAEMYRQGLELSSRTTH